MSNYKNENENENENEYEYKYNKLKNYEKMYSFYQRIPIEINVNHIGQYLKYEKYYDNNNDIFVEYNTYDKNMRKLLSYKYLHNLIKNPINEKCYYDLAYIFKLYKFSPDNITSKYLCYLLGQIYNTKIELTKYEIGKLLYIIDEKYLEDVNDINYLEIKSYNHSLINIKDKINDSKIQTCDNEFNVNDCNITLLKLQNDVFKLKSELNTIEKKLNNFNNKYTID